MTADKTIGEVWDFEYFERQQKLARLLKEHEEDRKARYGQGTAIDDFERATPQ
jgi:hypothetical protein